jgi:hypothetical protein
VVFPAVLHGPTDPGEDGDRVQIVHPGGSLLADAPILAGSIEHADGLADPAIVEVPLNSERNIRPVHFTPGDATPRMFHLREKAGTDGFSKEAFEYSLKAYKLDQNGKSPTLSKHERSVRLYKKWRASGVDTSPIYSVGSIVSSSVALMKEGKITEGGIRSYLSAFAEINPELATHPSVVKVRKVSKLNQKVYLSTPSICCALGIIRIHTEFLQRRGTLARTEPYFDVHAVLQTFGIVEKKRTKLGKWPRKLLEENTATTLHLDLSARAGETAKLIHHGLRTSRRWGIQGFLWDTKESPGALTPVQVNHCHDYYPPEWCSPCLVEELMSRTRSFKRANDIDCSPHLAEKTSGLFLWTHQRDGKFKSLGSNAVSNLVLAALERAQVPKHWTAHKLRGLSASKAINMGWPWQESLLRGRWSPSSNTFKTSYYRKTLYEETSPNNSKLSFEVVIRLKETRLV